MPYHIVKSVVHPGKYQIKTPTKTLKGHYKSRASASRVVRYLYARESKGFRGKGKG